MIVLLLTSNREIMGKRCESRVAEWLVLATLVLMTAASIAMFATWR